MADAAAKRLIPSTLELGGKSANIYFPDCKWDMAMDGLQLGILFNQGQVCCAGSRVFVHEDIYDRFVKEAVEAFDRVKVGMPWEAETQMGFQIYEEHLQSILRYIEEGKKEGAKVACGGERLANGDFAKGCFMKPTLLVDVKNNMKVAQEEIFGPVAVIIRFKTEEEVIEMANDNAYGLGGAVWTRDINRAIRVCRGIDTGRMWVNTLQRHPRGGSLRRLQGVRHRTGDAQGHSGALHADEEHHDQPRREPVGLLSREVERTPQTVGDGPTLAGGSVSYRLGYCSRFFANFTRRPARSAISRPHFRTGPFVRRPPPDEIPSLFLRVFRECAADCTGDADAAATMRESGYWQIQTETL